MFIDYLANVLLAGILISSIHQLLQILDFPVS